MTVFFTVSPGSEAVQGTLVPGQGFLHSEAVRPFEPTVYILASHYRGRLYVGVTSDLPGRLYQHREGTLPGYTERRDIKRLVWLERHDAIEAAIRREKTIKRWPRQWKFNVIEPGNPGWRDLAEDFGFPPLR